MWLSLIAPASPKVTAKRKKYAKLVGNIDDVRVSNPFTSFLFKLIIELQDLYPIFESAITGRTTLSNNEDEDSGGQRAGSIIDLANQTPEEAHKLRVAVVEQGLLTSIFDLLRRVPRRLLFVLKLKWGLNFLSPCGGTEAEELHPAAT